MFDWLRRGCYSYDRLSHNKKHHDVHPTPQKTSVWNTPTVLGLLLALVGLIVFWPRLTVESSGPVDPANPLSSAFTITNTGFIKLSDVDVSFGMGQMGFGGVALRPNFVPTFTALQTMREWSGHSLARDEAYTVTLSDFVNGGGPEPLTGADIAIVVQFKPWFLPWKCEEGRRFVTKKQTDGRLYWYHYPLDAPGPF